MVLARNKWLGLGGFAACAAAVLAARGSEAFLGLVPCAFCLMERKPYYAGLALSALALVLPARPARLLLWCLLGVLLVAAGLSFVHAGVELHFWPDPLPECTVPDFSGMTMAQRIAALPARPVKPCEFADYLIPGLPVSMTQMALLYALAVSAGLAICLLRSKERSIP
jgi:disulfide bond formation protein DsbB